MRASLLALLLLTSLLPAGPAGAAPEHLLSDPKGDTLLGARALGSATPTLQHSNDQSESTDLLALDVAETEETLTLTITVSSLKGAWTGSEYRTSLVWGDRTFRLLLAYFVDPGSSGTFTFSRLQASDGAGFDDVAPVDMVIDAERGTVSATLPKVLLLDGAKRTPAQGDRITGIRVASERTANFDEFAGLGFADAMPDAPGEGASYTIRLGDVSSGTLRLASDERVRVSNGGATTFVYRVDVRNSGDREDEVTLALTDLPAGWTGSVQSPVRVPAHGSKTTTVLASVPFAHKHGGFDAFLVTAKSARDPASAATLRMGVLHTPIPQPAGHHAELYIHGRYANNDVIANAFPYTYSWMNTVADHAGDPPEIMPNDCPDRGVRSWSVPLNPGLEMGLDFDLARTGTLAGTILGRDKGAVKIEAALYVVKEGADTREGGRVSFEKSTATLLAQSETLDAAFDPTAATPFQLTLRAKDAADHLPYAPDQNLWLILTTMTDGAAVVCSGVKGAPTLLTGDFKLSLPLEEYHDKLTGLAEVASEIGLVAVGPVEKLARPGSVMTYAFDVTNTGDATDLVLELAGTDARLGTLVPDGLVRLAAKETRRVTLGVHVPADAQDGEVLEVLLFAHAADDPEKRAVGRTKTTVGRGADALDDEASVLQAARADAGRETPSASLLAMVLVLLATARVAIARRRP